MYKWLAAALATIILAAGCAAGERPESSPSPQSNGTVQTRQTDDGKAMITDPTAVAAQLEELAKGVDGVTNAHCVIFGNTAIVGIDVDGELERSRVGTIKYSVAEALQHDPYGIDALVTADIDITERLAEMGASIRAGHPIAGFAEQLADIIGRLMPQFPRDIAPSGENDPHAPADEQSPEATAPPR